MRKIIINHTNKLLQSAKFLAANNSVNTIPFPSKHFKNSKEFERYLDSLTNFIMHPELYYLYSNKIESQKIKNIKDIPKKYFKFID